ncbi:S-layer protein [Candidatus Woesearchaeota archaeon]|nr:S-layer protein [Candidatus Woesearchaeota archaeon]
MKTVNRLKKVVALGMGLSMVGATLFGASAAGLGDYPAPFVKSGVPASNLAVVVGDNAAASDVVGMGDIIAGLQAAAVSKEAVPGAGASRVVLKGDSVELGSPTDLLELNESIGSVRESISEFDLALLKGGSISTQRGVTKYNQYIQFNNSQIYPSEKVIFTEDEFDNVGTFLFIRDQDPLFDWVLEFEEGFVSDATNGNAGTLPDLQDRELNVLGTTYAVVNTQINFSGASSRVDDVRLELLGGPVYDELGEGDKKTYTLNGKEYEVEIVVISETNNEVLLKVNGQLLPKLHRAELEPTSDGTLMAIRDIIVTGKDTQSSVVRFYLGATKLQLKDNRLDDQTFLTAGATINNEVIEDSTVRIRGSGSEGGTTVTLNDVTYRLLSDALVGNLYVPPGHGVREYLDEPAGLLAPNWDLQYQGLTDTGVTNIKLHAVGRDEYKLEFTNQEGLNYVVPVFSNRAGNRLTLGEQAGTQHRMLWTVEAPNDLIYPIQSEDYFILSDLQQPQVSAGLLGFDPLAGGAGNSGQNPGNYGCVVPSTTASGSYGALQDNTAFTHVLKFQSAVNSSGVQQMTFNDLATGTKQVTWRLGGIQSPEPSQVANSVGPTAGAAGNATFNLIVGGNNYFGAVNFSGATSSAATVAMDLDGNGTIGRGTGRGNSGASGSVPGLLGNAWILVEGGAVLFINSSTNLSPAFDTIAGPGAVLSSSISPARNATGTGGPEGLTGATNEGASFLGGTIQNTGFGDTGCLTYSIVNKAFDEGQPDPDRVSMYNVSVPVVRRAGNTIGLNLTQYTTTAPSAQLYGLRGGLIALTSEPELKQQMGPYGDLFEFFDPFTSSTPEELTIEFPLAQRGAQVFVTAGEVTAEKMAGASADKLNKLPAGVSKLASEVSDIKAWNAVVVGGPCANEWADNLMGSPEPCQESVPAGKALLKLYEHANGNVALLVAGKDAADTRRGARALQTGEVAKAGAAKSAEVTGTSLTDVTVRAA